MAGWVKAVLFLFGGVAAAGGTAYVTGLLDPWLAPRPAVVAPAPETPAPAPQDEPAAAGEEAEAQAEAEVVADEPVTTPKQDRLTPPVFDLLRVEPDGSVLVAGKAGPEALVEVLSGETVLGKASAGTGGDFVVVLDDPLAPGDYRIALRATGPDDETVLSTGTAIVSIPETEDGQVLAMVEEPGAPAQLITVPQPAPETQAAGTQAPDAQPSEAAAPATAEEQVAESQVDAQAGGDEAAPEPAQAGDEAGEEAVAATEPQDEAATEAAQAEEAAPETEVAAADAGDEPAAPAGEPAATDIVAVEAVEIEGDTVFVAGRAEPGRTVRVYAGTVHLGDAVASDGGRFLVEAKRHLDVGTYMIRADLLGENGSVVARAVVPFDREPGESIAAVAPTQEAPEAQAEAAAPPADTAADEAADTTTPEAEVAVAPAAPEAADEEATAPPLQRVDGAVIIRRGDSLWRISRRVYGHGIRYSTIYLANQDQIRDPNRIWPGQVFSLPSETPEGEHADLEAIGEQAVRPEDRETTGQ